MATTTTESITTADRSRRGGAAPGLPAGMRRPRRRLDPVFLAFLLPTLVIFTLAITLPAVMGIVLSFTDSVGFGEFGFIGLTNYRAVFSDPAILQAYLFTMGFALVTVLLVNAIAFLLAIGLTSKIRGKIALRAVFVLPMVISGIVIAYVFSFLFSNSLPAAATALGFGPLEQSILANPDLAWIAIVIVTAWQAIPSTLLIYIAGVLSIPGDVYEAASLDGASSWRQLLSITVPLTAGYIVINLVIGFKNFLNAYDVIVGLTNGGPGTSTTSVAMSIFNGFSNGDYSYQMANATIFFVIAVVIAIVQLRATRGKASF
ncbi:raffinose/stachyose/melibiose transport system permease protein [Curtobacterium sp. PhB130]|uniref:carbohydrate ABC transporter permease n=1 Tax=unclassified Curtobacterium TaxID=257496 RepID=UPI000F4B0473|nr:MULTISPECIES: sugar ABC transporter permease [unclassified Curtobacterium]ROS75982.1 raffinose/stachyose/melibiose transport system permease protein [Curtobacterium sp. PhB130]TCK64322.1 raffinose/stachyose/melibiose transport system permease protein [Curtobacterium sp. PhB136]